MAATLTLDEAKRASQRREVDEAQQLTLQEAKTAAVTERAVPSLSVRLPPPLFEGQIERPVPISRDEPAKLPELPPPGGRAQLPGTEPAAGERISAAKRFVGDPWSALLPRVVPSASLPVSLGKQFVGELWNSFAAEKIKDYPGTIAKLLGPLLYRGDSASPQDWRVDVLQEALRPEGPDLRVELPPPRNFPEKAARTLGGAAAFIAEIAIAKRFLPSKLTPQVSNATAFEIANQIEGGPPGAGVAMSLALGGMGAIPARGTVGKLGKTAAESGLFFGAGYAVTRDPEQAAADALIPWTFAGYRSLRKHYTSRFKKTQRSLDELTGVAREARAVVENHDNIVRFIQKSSEGQLDRLMSKYGPRRDVDGTARAFVDLIKAKRAGHDISRRLPGEKPTADEIRATKVRPPAPVAPLATVQPQPAATPPLAEQLRPAAPIPSPALPTLIEAAPSKAAIPIARPVVLPGAAQAGPIRDPFDMPAEMGPGGQIVSPHEVIADMGSSFGVPIRLGHVSGKRPGLYKQKAEVVRLKGGHAGDLYLAAHEVAHHIDKTLNPRADLRPEMRAELRALDYDPKRQDEAEGFSEFVAQLLTDDTARLAAPRFHQLFVHEWLPKHPEVQASLLNAKRGANIVRQEGAEGRVRAARSKTGKPIEERGIGRQIHDWVSTLHRMFLDDMGALEKAMRAIRQKGVAVGPGQDFYNYARVLSRREAAMAQDAVYHGPRSLVTGQRLGPSLRDALQTLDNQTVEGFESFVDFLYARHAREVWDAGKNPGISKVDADYVYQKHADRPNWEKAADMITQWNKGHVEMLAEVGAISPDAASAIIQAYPAYIPLRRVVESLRATGRKGGIVNVKAPLYRLRGSGRQIIDPFAAMQIMSTQMHAAAIKTITANKIIDMAETIEGMGWMAERIPAPTQTMRARLSALKGQLEAAGADLSDADLDAVLSVTHATGFYKGGEPIAMTYRNGKPVWYQYDPELYRTIAGMEITRLPAWANIALWPLRTTAKAVRMGATGLRASFGLGRNPIRDLPHAMLQTEANPLRVPGRVIGYNIRYAQSLMKEARGKGGDPMVALFQRYGGPFSTWLGQDITQGYRSARDLVNDVQGRRAQGIILHPIHFLQYVLSFPEMAPRLGELEAVLAKHGITAADVRNGKPVPMAAAVEAMLAANESTIDFSRGGSLMRLVNSISAFSNVAIQGPAQALRKAGIRGREPGFAEWGRARRTLLRGTAMLTVPTLIYWWLNRDEDWYRELPSWRRFFFWNFATKKMKAAGKVLSIPRPFEYGIVFSALPETILDSTYRNHPGWIEGFIREVWRTQGLGLDDLAPDLFMTAVELITNYDFWRDRAVVSPRLEETREPRDQFNDWNTAANRYIGGKLNLSPAKLDHLVGKMTGNLGLDILRIPEEGPMRALGYGSFLPQTTRGHSLDEFYDALEAVKQQRGSMKLRGETKADVEERFKRLNTVTRVMADLRDAVPGKAGTEAGAQRNRWLTGLARYGLERMPLGAYPNPLTEDVLPAAVAKIRDRYIGARVWALTDNALPGPKKGERPAEYQQRYLERQHSIAAAKQELRRLDMLKPRYLDGLLQTETRRRGYRPQTWNKRRQILAVRLDLLNPERIKASVLQNVQGTRTEELLR